MPVRLRITLLFVLISMIILGLVCGGIYYFSYKERLDSIKTRLTNRALTTARLLGRTENFDKELVQRIDSLTTIALKNKIVQVYDSHNNKVYTYSDIAGDTLFVAPDILTDARSNKSRFFTNGHKEAIAYFYSDDSGGMVVVMAAEDTDGKQSLRSLFRMLLISFLMGTIFVLVAGYIFSARLLRPIKKITAEVNEISARNLERRLETGASRDEWYDLADTFNKLLNRLKESFELQRRFISNASHELSTPLTSISSQLEVSLQREREASEYRTVMQSILQDVKRMNTLTQTLLEFAKAAGNPGGLDIDLLRIDELIMRLPAEMAKLNKNYSVSLGFENLPEDDQYLLVFGNEALLFTALRNITQNACKYSPDNKADVRLDVSTDVIKISIIDKGPGIADAELNNIFQPFYRIEHGFTKGEGFGLGLSLSERIIKLHKGQLSAGPEPGAGTRFQIHLPPASKLG